MYQQLSWKVPDIWVSQLEGNGTTWSGRRRFQDPICCSLRSQTQSKSVRSYLCGTERKCWTCTSCIRPWQQKIRSKGARSIQVIWRASNLLPAEMVMIWAAACHITGSAVLSLPEVKPWQYMLKSNLCTFFPEFLEGLPLYKMCYDAKKNFQGQNHWI